MPSPRSGSQVISATCHCGAVHIEVARRPTSVTQCNCSICRRYGALWAYYTRRSVRLAPHPALLSTYVWQDKAVRFQRCKACGCVTHWDTADASPKGRFAVNARLMDQERIARTPIRVLDGDQSWHTLRTFMQPDIFISPFRIP